ncbi:MAG: hypothetical protein SFX73_27340 [Kofleriaceae bacterium]|nr:hypothetical protein [Kofleriaceae bacterium]
MRRTGLALVVIASCGGGGEAPPPRRGPVLPRPIDAAPPVDAAVVVDASPAGLAAPVDASLPQLALRCTASADRPRLATKAPVPDPAKFPLHRFAPASTQAPRVARGPDKPADYSDFTAEIAIAGDTVAFTEHRSIRLLVRDEPAREVNLRLLAGHVAVSPDGKTVAATLHPASDEDFPEHGIAIIDVATGEMTDQVGAGVALNLRFTAASKLLAQTHDPHPWVNAIDDFEVHDLARRTMRSIRIVAPYDRRAPKLQQISTPDAPNVTVRYVGQALDIGMSTVLSGRSIALITTRASYKRREQDGVTMSYEVNPFIALARLDDNHLVRGADLPVEGQVAAVGDCVFVATKAKTGEHFAWVFNVISGELARVALPPVNVTAIGGGGDWLALGYEDGTVSVVSADWTQHAYWRAGRLRVRAIAIDAAGNVATESAGELVRWAPR